MENKVLDGSEDFGHGITSLPESWNKYNTSSYLFRDLVLMKVENWLVEMGDVSCILNGKLGQNRGWKDKNEMIIMIAIIFWNLPGFNQERTWNIVHWSIFNPFNDSPDSWMIWRRPSRELWQGYLDSYRGWVLFAMVGTYLVWPVPCSSCDCESK